MDRIPEFVVFLLVAVVGGTCAGFAGISFHERMFTSGTVMVVGAVILLWCFVRYMLSLKEYKD